MIRVLAYIVLLALAAAGLAWLADRPGDVILVWQGYRIETSLMTALVALAVLILVILLLWDLLSTLWNAPRRIGAHWRMRRQARRYEALSRGLVAVAGGDALRASRAAAEAQRLAPGEPLTLLLKAQAAQLTGDDEAATAAFRALLSSQRTRLLGLRGLYIEARRRNEAGLARRYAEEAMKLAPGTGWASRALLRDQCAEGDWRGARETLEKLSDSRAIDAATARRWRAVLLTAEAMGLEDKNPDEAARLAGEAHKLAPDLVPAAVIAARLASHAGDVRRASRIIEETWRQEPHPDLAEVYAYARAGDSPRDRLRRVRALAKTWETHAESAIAIARAAIEAHDWTAAREALEPLAEKHPTERVCTLMAQIAEGSGDAGRVREWLARALRAPRDPAWTADGVVSDHWLPVSPVTGELDAFRWRVPVEDIESPLIEAEQARFKPLPILTERPPTPEPVPEPVHPEPAAESTAPAPQTSAPSTVAEPQVAAADTATAPPVSAERQAPSVATPTVAATVEPTAAASHAPPEAAADEAPAARADNTAAPPFRTSPAGLTKVASATKAGRNGEDKPRSVVLARPPDDPGIEPPEAEERGRFRLF